MSGIVLEFDCVCGDFKVSSDKFPSYDAYRQITNVHRERCIKASRATEGEAAALEQTAEPRATAPRPVRQAADATSTPASAANQLGRNRAESGTDLASRIRGGFILFVACPTLVVAWVASGIARGLS